METTTAQHTATPWAVYENRDSVLIGTDDLWIAEIAVGKGYDQERPEAQANAAFIVRAVNSHEELVAALQQIVKTAEYGSPRQSDSTLRIAQIARAALANATT